MRKIRTAIAILLAPGFVAVAILVTNLLFRSHIPNLQYVPAILAITYAITFIPTAVIVLALKAMSLRELKHYVLAGLIVGVGCIMYFLITGYSALLNEPKTWVTKVMVYWPLFPIGMIAGVFVWVIAEGPSSKAPNNVGERLKTFGSAMFGR